MDVRRLFPPTVALFSVFGIFLFSSVSQAQINAPPSSVTSPGFGGRAVNGTAPSVTSVGPRGYSQPAHVPLRPPASNPGDGHHRRHRNGEYIGPYLYAFPVPYAVDSSAYADAPDSGDDADYQGGPTVFDRRGSGARSYIPPVDDAPAPHGAQGEQLDTAAPDLEPPSPSTLLVFKDGHQLEIGNYAIVGITLFDLTPGHSRKIPLANLDLEATQKQNEERGVTFQVPTSAQGN